MKSPSVILAVFPIVVQIAVILAQGSAPLQERNPQQTKNGLLYHEHPPVEPLPETLDPALFTDDHGAFVVYVLASRIREVLYQVPCYCYCNKREGHQSLLDCYTSKHGRFCDVCRQEALFSYLEAKKGKTPAQIRKGLAKGKAWKLDLDKLTNEWFSALSEELNPTSRKSSTNSVRRAECCNQ